MTATLCVHWFNPAVWMMYVLANRDLELSCGEVAVLVIGMTTAFATLKQPVELKSPADFHLDQIVEQDVTVSSYADPKDGKTYYSWGGGKAWIAMSNTEFKAGFALPEIEWWMTEEYEAWWKRSGYKA